MSPHLDNWGFPPWLVCICESGNYFDDAAKLLINEFGFVYSPFENPDKKNRALVLPRPDIDLKAFIESNEPFGWGVGRTRFDKYRYESQNRGPEYDFSYFADDCPWELIRNNPSRNAMIKLFEVLRPIRFINYKGKEIPFPYL